MQTLLVILGLYVIPGLITTALVSLAARLEENRSLDLLEVLLTFAVWPYFLVALIVHLN